MRSSRSFAGAPPRLGPHRAPYIVVAGVLLTFWAAVVVCVAAVFIIAAWHDRGTDGASASAATATLVAAPTATATPPVPRPRDVPLTAQPVEGSFDSGAPAQHLFFHIGCVNGILAVVTTDEHVYAQTFCPTLTREQREPFLGQPVRITIAEGRLEITSPVAGKLQFAIDRAWVEKR